MERKTDGTFDAFVPVWSYYRKMYVALGTVLTRDDMRLFELTIPITVMPLVDFVLQLDDFSIVSKTLPLNCFEVSEWRSLRQAQLNGQFTPRRLKPAVVRAQAAAAPPEVPPAAPHAADVAEGIGVPPIQDHAHDDDIDPNLPDGWFEAALEDCSPAGMVLVMVLVLVMVMVLVQVTVSFVVLLVLVLGWCL
jgi:hypothetical protein